MTAPEFSGNAELVQNADRDVGPADDRVLRYVPETFLHEGAQEFWVMHGVVPKDVIVSKAKRMAPDTSLFRTVAPKDHLGLLEGGGPNCNRIAKILELRDKDIADAVGISRSAIDLRKNIVPKEVTDRLLEWSQALNLVAQFFAGDAEKTILWFKLPNPLLGGVQPRDMIRIGRFERLYLFIRDALADLPPKPEAGA